MIEELTKEQEAKMPEYVEKWLKIGLCCEPLEFEPAREAAILAYKAADLEPPTLWYVADSPLSGAMLAFLLSKIDLDEIKAAQAKDQQQLQAVLERLASELSKSILNHAWQRSRAEDCSFVEAIARSLDGIRDSVAELLRVPVQTLASRKLKSKAKQAAGTRPRGVRRLLLSICDSLLQQIKQEGVPTGDPVHSAIFRAADRADMDLTAAVDRNLMFASQALINMAVQSQVAFNADLTLEELEQSLTDSHLESVPGWSEAKAAKSTWKEHLKEVEQLALQLIDGAIPRHTLKVLDDVLAKIGKMRSDTVTKELKDQVSAQIYGAHDAGWLSFYDFMLTELNLTCVEPLTGLLKLAQHCGWWAPYRTVCILQHRPLECHMEDGRLHRADGPAARYRDGFCVWGLNGVRVDEQIVMFPETQTLEQIRKEENEEVKRIRIERYGWEKYLDGIQAKVLDRRTNEIEQTEEALMNGDGMVVLCCACPSTARVYFLEVPDTVKTCEEAQDFLSSGLSKKIVLGS